MDQFRDFPVYFSLPLHSNQVTNMSSPNMILPLNYGPKTREENDPYSYIINNG
jgi:hypothetical protein